MKLEIRISIIISRFRALRVISLRAALRLEVSEHCSMYFSMLLFLCLWSSACAFAPLSARSCKSCGLGGSDRVRNSNVQERLPSVTTSGRKWTLNAAATVAVTNRAVVSTTTSSSASSILISAQKLSNSLLILLGSLIPVISPTIAGGLLSGSLHAITGPDHIAALLPASVGQPASTGIRIGAIWGFGHGISAIFLGLCAFFLKGRISSKFVMLEKLSTVAESAVGLSLLAIGGIGIKESLESARVSRENKVDGHGDGSEEAALSKMKSPRAIFANGVLHGFSWDGAPSLAPALAMTSWSATLSFLFAYCFGTMAAMSLAAGTVGEASVRLGKAVGSNKLPQQLSFGSSVLAVIIGLYWLFAAAVL